MGVMKHLSSLGSSKGGKCMSPQLKLAANSSENLLSKNSPPTTPKQSRAHPQQDPSQSQLHPSYPSNTRNSNLQKGLTNLTLHPAGAAQQPQPSEKESFDEMTAERFQYLETRIVLKDGELVLAALEELEKFFTTCLVEELDIRPSVMSKMVTSLCRLIRSFHPVVGLQATKVTTWLLLQTTISLDMNELMSKTIQNMAMSEFNDLEYEIAVINIICVFSARCDRGEQCVRECLSIITSLASVESQSPENKMMLLLAMACLASTEPPKRVVAEYHEDYFARLAAIQADGNSKIKILCAFAGAITVAAAKEAGQSHEGRCDYFLALCAVWCEDQEWDDGPEQLLPTLKQYCRTSKIKSTEIQLPGDTVTLATLGALGRHIFWSHVLPHNLFEFTMGKHTLTYHKCYLSKTDGDQKKARRTRWSISGAEDTLGPMRPKSIITRIKRRNSCGVSTKRR